MQSSSQLTWFAAEFLEEILELTKNRARMLLENQSFRRKQNAFSPTLKERHPKTGFQITHLLGDTWLRNAQAIRRATKATGLGHGEEVAQVTDLYRVLHRDRILCGSTDECNK